MFRSSNGVEMRRLVKILVGVGRVVAPFEHREYSLSGGFATDRRNLRQDVRRFGNNVKTASEKVKAHRDGAAYCR
jgi:hypothetical protein